MALVLHPLARETSKTPDPEQGLVLRDPRWRELLRADDAPYLTVERRARACGLVCGIADRRDLDPRLREEAELAARFVLAAQSNWIGWQMEDVEVGRAPTPSPLPAPARVIGLPAAFPFPTRAWTRTYVAAAEVVGERMVVGRWSNDVELIDLASGAIVATFAFPPDNAARGDHVEGVALASDLSCVALTGSCGRMVGVWELPAGEPRWAQPQTASNAARVRWLPNALLTTDVDDLVLRDAGDGRVLAVMQAPQVPGVRAVLYALDVHPSGAWAIAAHAWGSAQIWDLTSATRSGEITGLGHARAAALSPASDRAAALGDNGQLVITTRDGEPIARVDAHAKRGTSCAFSRDGALVATGAEDGSLRVWSAAGAPVSAPGKRAADKHRSAARRVAFGPSGELASAAAMCVKVWEPTSGRLLRTLAGMRPTGGLKSAIAGLAWRDDGAIVVWGMDGAVRVFA